MREIPLICLMLAAVPGMCASDEQIPPAVEQSCIEREPTMACTTIEMVTNLGPVEIELYDAKAPKACKNFATLAQRGFYNGVTFHRIIKNFMAQGGDPTGTGAGGESIYGARFEDECTPDLKFDQAGVLAMANCGPNTNSSQFFITFAACPWLNGRHTIFGRVTKGMETVRNMEAAKTGPQDRPVEPVVIKSIQVRSSTPATSAETSTSA